MANQRVPIHGRMRRRLLQQHADGDRRVRLRLLIIDSAAVLMSIAASVVIVHAGAAEPESSAVGGGTAACPLVAFLLFLLGVSLAMVALVADEFP